MHNDITLANTTKGISLYIHLSIRSIASQQANGRNTSEAHHQPVQAICSTYLLSYININQSGKTVGNYRFDLFSIDMPRNTFLSNCSQKRCQTFHIIKFFYFGIISLSNSFFLPTFRNNR